MTRRRVNPHHVRQAQRFRDNPLDLTPAEPVETERQREERLDREAKWSERPDPPLDD